MKMERVRIKVGEKLILQLEPEQHLLFCQKVGNIQVLLVFPFSKRE